MPPRQLASLRIDNLRSDPTCVQDDEAVRPRVASLREDSDRAVSSCSLCLLGGGGRSGQGDGPVRGPEKVTWCSRNLPERW
jgi:hypothetical protein